MISFEWLNGWVFYWSLHALSVILVLTYFFKSQISQLKDLNRGHVSSFERRSTFFFVTRVIVLVVTSPLVILLFGLIGLLDRFSRSSSADLFQTNKHVFKVLPEYLIGETMSVGDVEAQANIDDPLKAVPELPFGFLYPRWLEFRVQLLKDSRLQHFEGPYEGRINSGLAEINPKGKVVNFWVNQLRSEFREVK